MNVAQRSKLRLAARLKSLTADFRLVWGRPASRCDGVVDVSIDRVFREQDELEYIVTVSAGFPPVPAVAGLPWTVRDAASGQIRRVGQTDARGQFPLRGLAPAPGAPAEYLVQIEGLVAAPAVATIDAKFAAAHAATALPRQDFHSDHVATSLRMTPADRWVLDAEIDLKADIESTDSSTRKVELARVRISDPQNNLLLQAYLGLYEVSDRQAAVGELNLDLIDRTLRSRTPGCDIHVALLDRSDLTPSDGEALRQSLNATEHPRSREVLKAAIDEIDRKAKQSGSK